MVLKGKKLFFDTIFMVLEDGKVDEIINSNKFSSIIVISHKDLSLPKFRTRTKTTAIIDLNDEEDEIFKKFNDTTRNEIRKTYKLPEIKIVADDKNFDGVYSLYKNFEYEQSRVPFSKNNLKNCMIFSAYLNGSVISGIFVDVGEKDLRIRFIFSKRLETEDKEMYRTIAYATRRLMWEICLWGKAGGYNSLDLASVNFKNPDVSNITQFKMSFGGKVINEYTYTYKSFAYSIIEKLVVVKNAIKKIFRI
jgi:hypothetical protein